MHGNIHRKSDIWSNISLSLLIILISNPYNIKNNGVLLSYFGTIGIISFLEIFKGENKEKLSENIKSKITKYVKNIFLVSLSVQIAIIPIIAYSYKTISLTFFITNILISGLIGAIIISGFILILTSFINVNLSLILGKIYKILIDILLFITEYTSKIPLSKIYIKTPYIWEILIYYIVIFGGFAYYKKVRKRYIFRKNKKYIKINKKQI